jgi:nucleoside-diphosphate-sugar epimerase
VLNEESKWMGGSTSDYAESKYRAELEVFRGAEEGLTISMVNPSVILSGAETRSSGSLFEYVWNENSFYTTGVLNYVDARDVAGVIFQLYQEPRSGERFILNAGAIPYRDFFVRVAQLLGKRAPNHLLSSRLAFWAGLAEEWRARLLMRDPLVTRQSARMSIQSYQYDTSKVTRELNYRFRPLEETLAWCCQDFLRNVTLNK